MALTAGSRLGPYEILAPIGAGGMGEVYRARDTKLKREVALKVLPEAFAADPERMARFQREAEVLASLNHPNIAQIYGVEERALVMELVDGESPKGPMPFEEAWKIASQIAAGLEYAHEKGIVHRDLKPANIKITPDGVVKLLDFGLAKAFTGQAAASGNPENSPTLTLGATQLGVILGTAAYMAPEQAKGKTVDKRADIWSFGVVFYELLTGERLFSGDDVSDTLADVLKKQPNLDKVPPEARQLLRECLEKDPKHRLRDVGDAKRLLLQEAPGQAQAESRPYRRLPWIAAGTLALVAATTTLLWLRGRSQEESVLMQFEITPSPQAAIDGIPAISPDGQSLAFIAAASGTPMLYVRPLSSLEARALPGTENALYAFWSPDGRSLAFTAGTGQGGTNSVLKRIDLAGGGPRVLITNSNAAVGNNGTWNQQGDILFLDLARQQVILRTSASGGSVAPVTQLDLKKGEVSHRFPVFLPDGRHFLFFAYGKDQSHNTVEFATLGSFDRKTVMQDVSAAIYARDTNGKGYLLYQRDQTLLAQRFDESAGVVLGESAAIADNVASVGQNGRLPVATASWNGTLVFRNGSSGSRLQLTWFDRDGKALGTVGDPGDYYTVSLSPDGTRAVVGRNDRGNIDLWVLEFGRGTNTRLTFNPGQDAPAIWSPDGSRIVFSSQRDGPVNLYEKPSSGAGSEAAVFKSNDRKFILDWSHDGRFLLYSLIGSTSGIDLWVLPLEGERKPQPYLRTEFSEAQGRFSPDDRYIAYSSDASGRREIYVRPFPSSSAGLWQVSQGGGTQPRWRGDGKELFYISLDSKLMAVDVSTTPAFKAGVPRALFRAPILGAGVTTNVTHYDVAADGKKFLINSAPSEAASEKATPITVMLNWQASLKK